MNTYQKKKVVLATVSGRKGGETAEQKQIGEKWVKKSMAAEGAGSKNWGGDESLKHC